MLLDIDHPLINPSGEVRIMELCPSCGANVEGLTHYCDCCGAMLNAIDPFFVWHTFVTIESGDLYVFMNELFKQFDNWDYSQYRKVLQTVEINVFCYPKAMITEHGIKNRCYLSTAKKKAGLTIVLNFDEYIKGSVVQKRRLLSSAIKTGVICIGEKASKRNLGIDQFIEKIIKSL